MLVNTQVRQEEDGTIPSPKGRQLGNGQGCYLTASVNIISASNLQKIEDGRCLVVEIQDQIQNGSFSND
jgi:hypothetical protein